MVACGKLISNIMPLNMSCMNFTCRSNVILVFCKIEITAMELLLYGMRYLSYL